MAVSLFQNRVGEALKRLAARDYASSEERDVLLATVTESTELKPRDVMWMLFRPERALRDAGLESLRRHRGIEIVDLFVGHCRDKPSAALRAASDDLFRLGIPGTEARLARLATEGDPAVRDIACRLVIEAPATRALTPILWQLADQAGPEERLRIFDRLADHEVDDKAIQRWTAIAREEDDAGLRERALVVLADKAPRAGVELFVEELAHSSYSTQQHLIEALIGEASRRGPEFAEQILPLLASADAGTRSAGIKVLLSFTERREVVKRALLFSKTLAGWARDRALDSMRAFDQDLLEPIIELLADPDDDVRSLAVVVASSFEDPRIVPSTIDLLRDPDWWIRIMAADTLGRLEDRRAVGPLIAALEDPEVRWAAVEALGRIGDPEALDPLGRLLADPAPEVRIEVLLALSGFDDPRVTELLEKTITGDPSRAVRARGMEILEEMSRRGSAAIRDEESLRKAVSSIQVGRGEPVLHSLLVGTRNQGGSDLHVAVGEPPTVRLASRLVRSKNAPLTAEQTERLLREILSDEQWRRLSAEQYLDFCYYIPDAGRYRGNIFLDHRGYQGVFRVIPEEPPTITDIGLPPHLEAIADYHQGLVLVCGPAGSGKTTTQAALVNLLNDTRQGHIITLEEPVEFVHPFKSCLINQREVGSHTVSFAKALRAALREDPDVIVIGDLRDNETTEQALVAAETGHVVLATLSSTSAAKAIDRIIASFPANEQPQIRTSLSESLAFVIAQRLLPRKGSRDQIACFEVLKGTMSIGNLIRDEKTYQIASALQIGRSLGMQSFDDALRDLVKRDLIEPETAYMAAHKKEDFEALVPTEFLEKTTFL